MPEIRVYRIPEAEEAFTWRLVGERYDEGPQEVLAQPAPTKTFASAALAREDADAVQLAFLRAAVVQDLVEWPGGV